MKKIIIFIMFLSLSQLYFTKNHTVDETTVNYSAQDDSLVNVKNQPEMFNNDENLSLNSEILEQYLAIKNPDASILEKIAMCYADQQNWTLSLLFLKRAWLRASIKQVFSLAHHEQIAQEKLKIVQSKPYFYSKIAFFVIPLILIEIMIVVLFLCLLVQIAHCWRWQELSKKDLKKILGYILLIVFCCLIWWIKLQFLEKNKAIVVKSDVYVYAGPELTFHKVCTLEQGTLVKIIKQEQSMYHIQSKHAVGWVMQDDIKSIEPYE